MSDEEKENQGRGFKVTDRRRFAGGAVTSKASQAAETRAEEAKTEGGQESAASSGRAQEAGREGGEITFSTFIMGLSTQTLMSLGEIASPVDGQRKRDLGAAKELIDLLGILRDKTAGNLDKNEQELIDGMLYDLRLRYVEVARGR